MRQYALALFLLTVLPLGVQSQDFKKVVEVIVDIESSLKKMIEEEKLQRKADVTTLRSEMKELRESLQPHFSGVTVAASTGEWAVNGIGSIVHRIEAVEKKIESIQLLPDVSALAAQLNDLLTELKKTIEQTTNTPSAASQAVPAPTYSISGQIRHRSETDGKSFVPQSKAVSFHLLRSRVNILVKPIQDVSVFVQVQDARLFGGGNSALARGTMDGSAKALDFHQAYFSVNKLFSTPISVKLGRQELVYGNERLIGGVGWSNVGRSFDGAVISYSTDDVVFDLFGTKLVGSQTSTASENFRGIYSTLRFFQPHLLDAFALFDDNTSQLLRGVDAGKPKLARYTLGTYVRGKPNPIDYEFEIAYQGGKTAVNDTSARASIAAYLLSGSFGYTLDPEKKLRIGVLYTRLSGDDDPADETARTFNTLFATNHKFYGYMDYFPGIRPDFGLQDVALSLSMNLAANVGLAIDLHQFSLERDAPIVDATGAKIKKSSIGQEIDLTVTVKYNANFSFVAGASAFVPDDVMRSVRGSGTSFWSYLMTQVNF